MIDTNVSILNEKIRFFFFFPFFFLFVVVLLLVFFLKKRKKDMNLEKAETFMKTKKKQEAASLYLARQKAGAAPLSGCSSHFQCETLKVVEVFCLKYQVCGSSPHMQAPHEFIGFIP